MNDDFESDDLLSCLRLEPDVADLKEVRRRVLAEITSRRSIHPFWTWSPVVAGLAVLCAWVLMWRSHPKTTEFALPSSSLPYISERFVPELPNLTLHRFTSDRAPRKTNEIAAGMRTVTMIAQAKGAPVLKMTTADPNVVILWQTRDASESEDEQ